MTAFNTSCLRNCLTDYHDTLPELAPIARQLPTAVTAETLALVISLYDQCYPLLEKHLWGETENFTPLLADYQALFREQDKLIRQASDDGLADERYQFMLSIPVADRPPHLHACLESIYQVCSQFGYGGMSSDADNGKYFNNIKIIVAEDSRDAENIRRHRTLIEEYQQKGLQIVHFDQDEQFQLLHSLPAEQRQLLGNLLTTQPKEKFYLKGQAANRNLSYLKFLQLCEQGADKNNTLFYLVDSDQSFCVNRQTEHGEQVVYALNYFHYIDKLFRETDTLMVTGKLVGDPPVSPSVMTASFLDDVTAFFNQLAATTQQQPCQFHTSLDEAIGDAAYHDMANLFGFTQQRSSYPYRCRLTGSHDHAACLTGFAKRLNAFFFGEHLTRKTTFSYGNGFTANTPARTIYPGNYTVNYAGLKYIIPFGNLRLRMSGPTAGRLIAAEIGDRFTTINIPHLHRRTTEAGLTDDFRPGVELNDEATENIDLSNEFERQFFGDLMLFSTEALVNQTDVNQPFNPKQVSAVVDEKEAELLALYEQKHDAILAKNNQLRALVFNADQWWNTAPALQPALLRIKTFINNIAHNFGEQSLAWQQIQSTSHRETRKQQIIQALVNYRAERDAWDRLF